MLCSRSRWSSAFSAARFYLSRQNPIINLSILILPFYHSCSKTLCLPSRWATNPQCSAPRLIFPFAESREFEDSIERAEPFYLCAVSLVRQSEGADAWLSVLVSDTEEADRACRVLLLMCLGVASFLTFTQINVTGPLEKLSPFPLPFFALDVEKTSGGGEQWDMWARRQLMASGSDLLGKCSLLQTEAKPQMVLVADINEQNNHGLINAGGASADKMLLHSDDRRANCDILMIPKLVENGNTDRAILDAIQKDNTFKMPLNAIQHAVILVQCLIIKSNNRDDEMLGWEMALFIEAIDAQQLSYFIVESVYEVFLGPAQTMHFVYGLYVPTIPAMRKEYGELLVGCGMIGEALKTFEDLELWDSLINCYRLLGKKAAAVDLVKARLCHTPNYPLQWCSQSIGRFK